MRLRSRPKMDDPFDGLTAQEVLRIRGMAAVSTVPGMEGLARAMAKKPMTLDEAAEVMQKSYGTKSKRGRRA